MENFGLTAYNFEPEYTEEELSNINLSTSSDEQHQLAVDEWCDCGNCGEMENLDENMCCKRNDLTVANLDDMECITNHENFSDIVLNSVILEIAFIQIMLFKGQRGRAPESLTAQQSRLTAYRQFVCWMLKGEKLGKGKRVVLPSCVVVAIRKKFPSLDGHYTGFKTVLDSLRDLFP